MKTFCPKIFCAKWFAPTVQSVYFIQIDSGTEQPENYNLPSDYSFAANSWGNSFYKTYGKKDYASAKTQCESDGALLAFPRSDAENTFIASLIPGEHIFIGVNDIDNEGTFVSIDGNPLSYTNWFSSDVSEQSDHIGNNQPNDLGGGEDVAIILGFGDDSDGYWGDTSQTDAIRFVCSFDIPAFVLPGRFHC